MSKKSFVFPMLLLVVLVLLILNLAMGSVSIPARQVVSILTGHDEGVKESWRYIVLYSRLPQSLMALIGGSALAVSGLLMQTAFRNPLAGPDVFGINGGAALAVALVMLAMGGSVSVGGFSLGGYVAVLGAAFVGAMVVTAIIALFSTWVRSHVVLLIVGLMVGYLASSAISLLNFFATSEGVKSYMIWGMGSLSGVSLDDIPVATILIGLSLGVSFFFVKHLNALLLGEQYAISLGFGVRRFRLALLIVTGVLTGTVTAFCGPISFIGLATPHIARLVLTTEDHRTLLPVTLLLGGVIALLCNWVCCLPSQNGVLPLGAVTPLLGAPVIIYVLVKRRS